MSDERTYAQIVAACTRREVLEFENDPVAQGQKQIDWVMEQKLAAQRGGVSNVRSEYDPFAPSRMGS